MRLPKAIEPSHPVCQIKNKKKLWLLIALTMSIYIYKNSAIIVQATADRDACTGTNKHVFFHLYICWAYITVQERSLSISSTSAGESPINSAIDGAIILSLTQTSAYLDIQTKWCRTKTVNRRITQHFTPSGFGWPLTQHEQLFKKRCTWHMTQRKHMLVFCLPIA